MRALCRAGSMFAKGKMAMDKYILGWILGAPMALLLALYFFVH
ncbi:hypothetical protein CFter6_3287 [Collimonas fungivorans]|uniref:Uncharacterized protein n=1 Tax=Collimonas fungivorans TaxID=158899 RepID=A0A127PDP6_9BURK|nr:hypothetical protein CFter6_3287 [Collimonas fungivorans]